jgi:predicted HTH transcriptional regulator
MAKKKQPEPAPRKKRRGLDEQIAALEAKIHAIKDREARKQASKDPAHRFVKTAMKSIEKAIQVVKDGAQKKALNEARSALTSGFAQTSLTSQAGSGRARRSAHEIEDLAEQLLEYVRSNPGQRGEEIAAAMATDSATIRPVMKKLIAAGKVTTEGQKRGMTYSAT